jgi:cell division protein FtsQ
MSDELALRRNRKKFRRALILSGLVLVISGLVWVFYFSELLTLKKISVVGNLKHTTVEEVIKSVNIPAGIQLARLDRAVVLASLSDIPSILEIELRRVWPSEVVLAISEREPVLVEKGNQGWVFVAADGTVFGQLEIRPQEFLEVRSASDAARAEAANLLGQLPLWLQDLVLLINAESANNIQLDLEDGRTVVWGNSKDSELKADVLKALFEVDAKVLDVSAPNLPVTRDK